MVITITSGLDEPGDSFAEFLINWIVSLQFKVMLFEDHVPGIMIDITKISYQKNVYTALKCVKKE